ncbi:MAG: DUF4292 domain-containing protein [Bacteroidetes bacterium]|nr:DUF4292 domain-containing protein [Bacteroidota bacterium]
MNNRRFTVLLLLYTVSVLSFSSCSTARKVMKQPIREEGVDYIFNLLKKNELKFDWLSAKFNASFEVNNKKSHISGQIRIKKDSLIWVSLTPILGLEAARILINLDSVFFMNRIDNTFLTSDFTYINAYLNSGFDFDLLQSLIVGNDLSYYENDKFKVNIDNLKYRLNTIGRRKLKKYVRNSTENRKVLLQNIWVNPDNGKIEQLNVKELNKENKKLEARYSDFVTIGNQVIPGRITMEIKAEKNINIDIEFSKIKLNEPLNFPFTIPSKYTRISGK